MGDEVPLIGLARECERLDRALDQRESLLLVGPRGAGKSRVLRDAVARQRDALYLSCPPVHHNLLASLAQLLGMDDRGRSRYDI